MKQNSVLEVSNLSKSFAGKRVIDDLSFKVEAGDIYGFLGPNGAGKTTTIRMILSLIHLDSGDIKINGYDIKKDFKNAYESIGAVVETPRFYDYLSAYDNLVQIANLHSNISKKRISQVLEIVGLQERSMDKVKTYSLGMKQRLGIARALINNPRLVFLDEPTNGLDPQGMIEIRNMVSQLAIEQGITFFITTHMLHEVEQICNKVAILQKGKLITESSVKDLLSKDTEYLQVHTKDIDKAIEALKQVSFINRIDNAPFGLNVEVDKGFSSELIKLLIENNIAVQYLIPQNQTLEQLFIELTGGNNHV